MSPAVHRSSTMRRGPSEESGSPVRARGSPRRRSPSRKERSPARRRSSPRAVSPVRTHSSHRARSPAREKEKLSSRDRSPKRGRPVPPASRSPSPRTKRLKSAQAALEGDKVGDRERGRNNAREGDRERNVDREASVERSERRSGRDKKDGGSSRSRHKRSDSPMERGHGNNRHGSRSPPRGSRSGGRDKVSSPRGEDHRNDDDDSVARTKAAEAALEAKDKQKPSFELSGKLAAETNRVRGVTLLFNEPSDARKPDIRWRLYVFKGGEVLNEPLYIHRQSCYLFGRERRVADIPTDHPSCSKQHAVIQFRQVEKEQPDGMLSKKSRVCAVARELGLVKSANLILGLERQHYCVGIPRTKILLTGASRFHLVDVDDIGLYVLGHYQISDVYETRWISCVSLNIVEQIVLLTK